MTIQIELNPETEAMLTLAAEASGVAREQFAGSLLKEALASRLQPSGRLTVEESRAMLLEIAEDSQGLPVLPDAALTRESF